MRRPARDGERGVMVIIVLILLTAVVVMVSAFVSVLGQSRRAHLFADTQERGLAVAEAGIEKAIWELSRPDPSYRGETGTRLGDGYFTISVAAVEGAPDTWIIRSSGQLEEEIAARLRRPSSVPNVTARVQVDRRPDGRPALVRVLEWLVETPKSPIHDRATSGPAGRPA